MASISKNSRLFYTIIIVGLFGSPFGYGAPIEPENNPLEKYEYPQIANAQTPPEPERDRTSSTVILETDEFGRQRGITTVGLPPHIQDNQGEWVANIFNEDSNGVMLESATTSFYYDKDSCGLSEFADGRIDENSIPFIKSNSWVVKVAQNGTDTWTDIPQNDLDCVVTTSVDDGIISVNSTKSDSNGTIIENYLYEEYSGLKTTVYFTNNNTSWNDHKFYFANILEETPKSFGIRTWNQTAGNGTVQANFYSTYYPQNQPSLFGGIANVLNITSQEIVTFEYDDLFYNGTLVDNQFTWYDRIDSRMIGYEFDTAIDKLWEIKFLTQQDATIDIYIDYANTDEVLAVGATTSIDPTTLLTESDYMRVNSITNVANCNAGIGGASSVDSSRVVYMSASGSSRESCGYGVWKYDISPIPDTATPIELIWQFNTTANSRSGAIGKDADKFRPIFQEDIFGLSITTIGDVIYANTPAGLHEGYAFWDIGEMFPATGVAVGLDTLVHNNPIGTQIIAFEDQLESGIDFVSFSMCDQLSNCGFSTNAFSASQSRTFEPIEDAFFSVEWEQFSIPSAPQDPITATYSDTPDKCEVDWNAPLDDGGQPIDGYQIERSSGGAFQIIVADTGSALPTDYDDSTIISGISYTYRISAITSEGVGLASNVSNGCGVPVVSDEPFLNTLTNLAVGIVALDWTAPTFDGNDPITGYKIERTTGTPQNVPDLFEVQWHSYNPTYPCSPTFQHTGDNVGFFSLSNPRRCAFYMYATFDVGEVDGRTIVTDSNNDAWTQTHWFVIDGIVKQELAGHHFPTSTGFNATVDTTGDLVPDGGAGIIDTPFTLTGNVGRLERSSDPIDVQFATQPQVTLMLRCLEFSDVGTGGCQVYGWEFEGIADYTLGTTVTNVWTPNEANGEYEFNSGQFSEVNCCGFDLNVDGFFTLVDDTGDTQTEYLDNTVQESTQYGYRVSAINSIGTSDPSNLLSITSAGNPDTPVITTTATGTQTINISWSEPDLNEGTLVEYEIERKTGVAGIYAGLATTTNEFYDDGTGLFTLSPATEYCYRVKTITNVGESAFTGDSCATTFDAPSQVENLTVIAVDGSSVNMSFDDPLSDGGSAITGYQIEQKIGAGSFDIVQPSNSLNQVRNDTGLPVGTLISYRVTPFNQFGAGDQATASDTTDATPQVPPNFSCSASSSTSITLNWDTPITFSAPTGYQVDRREIGGGFSTIEADTGSTDTMYLDSGLPVDSTFEYRILAHTAEGDTDFTEIITCATLTAPNFPPEDLQGDFTTTVPHQMVLAWDIPDTFGVPISSFRIERDDGAGYNEIASVSGSTFMYIDQSPDNDVKQKYRVFTVGSEGDSPPSIAIPFPSNQTSHWHYEKTIDDTGKNKNSGMITGTANFNNTGINGLGHLFDGSTYITVDNESDYDYDQDQSMGFITYYRGNSTGVTQALISKSTTIGQQGFNVFVDATGVLGIRLTNTAGTNEIRVLGNTNVTDNSLHFLGVGYNGNGTANGVSLMVDGSFETKNIVTDTLTNPILNNEQLTIGATGDGSFKLTGLLDDTRIFGSDTLDDATLEAIANNSIDTVIPINATISISGTTFADISRESPVIIMTSGYPLPTVDTIDLQNFTATTVNTSTPAVVIDSETGVFTLDPELFNTMSSLSNYTAVGSLTNSEETFPLLSNFDIQEPIFTFSGDFYYQQQRDPTFTVLSFNYTQTDIPFDLACNFKSTLFGNGTTVTFNDVHFVQHLEPVPALEDVVVACIDQNTPPTDPDAPSFGGSNAILSFVSFGDTTGIGNFLNFTNNFGDFFGVGLPFLFVIILAAAFTGRSAPTGILIIGVALGIMWALGILTLDPYMWGVILVLIILGVLGGKKFL